jgi:hypothetical protein
MTTMNGNDHITISKDNLLPQSQDYYFLRREGLKLIEQLGSRIWTDYNIHDPGITILEVLCYAITDLSYRSSFSVKDLIAEEKPGVFDPETQAFFSAREILTTAPWTTNDYRKILIDLEEIRNAWIKCNECKCGPNIYVNCKKSELTFKKSDINKAVVSEVIPKGIYNVLLELDRDEQYGDLNTGKISLSFSCLIDGNPETLYLEVRFPSGQEINSLQKTDANLELFRHPESRVSNVEVTLISDKKNDAADIEESRVITALRSVMYATFEISFDEFLTTPGIAKTRKVTFRDVPFRFLLLKSEVRYEFVLQDIRDILKNRTESGIAARFMLKTQLADKAVAKALKVLNSHRNITEDFCCVEEVEIEEVGVCADIDLTPEADIEEVLAEIYYQIEEYFNPTVQFKTLDALLESKTVDEIFDGPKLIHGFIEDKDLEKNVLNRTLYSSDIINFIMDIPGVISVRNFVLIRFDREGRNTGPDPWKLKVSENHLPRLYIEGSKLLVFKNGLPFLPDTSELMDTIKVVSSRSTMQKLKDHDLDLDVPEGTYYPMKDYKPVQNTLPLVYGTGYESPPPRADDLRRAQAKQLKSYITFFEQLLVNYLGQLANLKQLFSVDNSVKQTYFPVFLGADLLKNDLYNDFATEFYKDFDAAGLKEMTENRDLFLNRRNKFLDHLLSRFSESFSEYALLLFSYKTQKKVASENLITSKTAFLKQFPWQSANKAQGFDHTVGEHICLNKDLSGIHNRISALLGIQNSLNYFDFVISKTEDGNYRSSLELRDSDDKVLLKLADLLEDKDRDIIVKQLNLNMSRILNLVTDKINYKVKPSSGKYIIELGVPVVAVSGEIFDNQIDANTEIDRIVDFSKLTLADERFIIVEHILLRPHGKGDPLLTVCVDSNCDFCGEEDPYSFKVTFVFDGESELPAKHFNFRKFAEKTIRNELPAHVMAKICWVKHDVFLAFEEAYCEWLSANSSARSLKLEKLVNIFKTLKSIYPSPTLHDCIDGNDENPVLLDQTQL